MKPLTHFSTDAIEYTQSKIFSLVCSIFDPLGILSPLTIRFKILLQEIWTLGKKWDEPLPVQIKRRLQEILDSYFEMPEVHLTRTLTSLQYSEISVEMHVFVDASTAAMAAVAYLRITHNHSEVTGTCFLIGKCKIVPIKKKLTQTWTRSGSNWSQATFHNRERVLFHNCQKCILDW